MKINKFVKFFIVIAFFASYALPASAVPVFFTDRAAFDLASGGGLNFESFEGNFAVSDTQTFTDFTVTETGGANFLGQLRDFPGLGIGSVIVDGTGGLGYDDNGSSLASFFSFSSAVNAFGIEIATSADSTVTIGGNVKTSFNLLAGVNAFFGVIDTSALFSSITFDVSGGPNVGFDAASYGIASVSEPATLLLLGLGLLGLGLTARRKKTL